jgi:hypothetical protein
VIYQNSVKPLPVHCYPLPEERVGDPASPEAHQAEVSAAAAEAVGNTLSPNRLK